MFTTKRLVTIAMFVALATVISIVERSIIIPGVHPGVKLGLANIITLLSILILGYKDAFFVVVIRCVLGALVGGNPVSFLFSITGGTLSLLVMSLMWHYLRNHISIINISIVGAICHNIGQLFVASILAQDFHIYILLPVLMISAIITGYNVGLLTKHVYKALRDRNIGDFGLS
ncbi:MAG: Gx transporter family protein [Desulfotomaculaceae bacterium]|nr:Gx transporter family protein [Desulfotomaculaceae bacterium]